MTARNELRALLASIDEVWRSARYSEEFAGMPTRRDAALRILSEAHEAVVSSAQVLYALPTDEAI